MKTKRGKATAKRSGKPANMSVPRSILNTMTSNKLLLFIVSFGVIGAVFAAYSSAAARPEIHLQIDKCRVLVATGNYTGVTARVTGNNIRTKTGSNLKARTYYSLPLQNVNGRTVKGDISVAMWTSRQTIKSVVFRGAQVPPRCR